MKTYYLFVILFVAFVGYLGIGLVYPIFAALVFDTNQTLIPSDASPEYRGTVLGILIALTPATQFFSSPLLGSLSDIHGRRKMLFWGIGAGIIGYAFAITALWISSLWLLYIYRILIGISDGTTAVSQAALADISTPENKSWHFSLFNGCLGAGFTIGPFLGGILTDTSTWHGYARPFIVAGGLACINFISVLWKFPETRTVIKEKSFHILDGLINIGKTFMWKKLRWLFIAGFCVFFGWSFYIEFIPVLLISRFNFSLKMIGDFYALAGLCFAICACFVTGHILKRFREESIIPKALLGTALCMLGFVFVSNTIYVWLLVPFLMLFFSIASPTIPAFVSHHTGEHQQGEVLGVYHSVGALAMSVSPLIGGAPIGAYPPLSAWGGACSMLLAALAFLVACRVIPENREEKSH